MLPQNHQKISAISLSESIFNIIVSPEICPKLEMEDIIDILRTITLENNAIYLIIALFSFIPKYKLWVYIRGINAFFSLFFFWKKSSHQLLPKQIINVLSFTRQKLWRLATQTMEFNEIQEKGKKPNNRNNILLYLYYRNNFLLMNFSSWRKLNIKKAVKEKLTKKAKSINQIVQIPKNMELITRKDTKKATKIVSQSKFEKKHILPKFTSKRNHRSDHFPLRFHLLF